MKFIIDNIILVALACSSGLGLLWMSLQNLGAKASPIQVTQMMNRGKHLILDVRDSTEFAGGCLQGAKNIPLAELEKRVSELDKFKALPVVVVCQSGNQSSKATAQLQRAGFEQAVSLEGGLAAWQSAGLPLHKQAAGGPQLAKK